MWSLINGKNLFLGNVNKGFCLLILLGYGFIFFSSKISGLLVLDFVFWESGCQKISMSLIFDMMSVMFIGAILVIVGSVMIYSKWYMFSEVYYSRFSKLVYLFVLSMLFMICIPNLVAILMGWDGLGLTSFLLVIYYQNNKSLSAGMLTALTNRIGDVFILMSIATMFSEGFWFIYSYSLSMVGNVLSVGLILSAITKSAQFPYVSWLPAAMAAPTPVSSLVHSSTLVTAGVYLLIRSHNVIVNDVFMMKVLEVLSLLTLLLAGSSAVATVDLKKMVALSTLSQLSMMMFVLSMGFPEVAFFHLVVHAVFKALLFLSVGSYIHFNGGCQDFRFMGQGWRDLPMSSGAMCVANFSLCGVPFTSGFFSKDLIVELSLMESEVMLVYLLEFMGVIFTSLYSVRMMLSVIFGKSKKYTYPFNIKETSVLFVPFWMLSLGAILLGESVIKNLTKLSGCCYMSTLESVMVFLIIIYGLTAFFFIVDVYSPIFYVKLLSFLGNMWFMENLSSQPLSFAFFKLSDSVIKSLDKGWLEFLGAQGLASGLMMISKINQKGQSHFFIFFLLSMGLLLFFISCMGCILF